jgi:hypothetical protein
VKVAAALILALLIAANAWLATGVAVPIRVGADVKHAVVLRPVIELGVWLLASLGLVIILRVRRMFAGYWLLLALPFLALALAATPAQPIAAPFLFLFVDLQRWLFGAIAVLACVQWWARQRGGFRFPSRRPRYAQHALLVIVVGATALMSSPRWRFQSAILGDEPKYLRFDENWYRGQGLDIETFPDIRDLGPSFRPNLLGNIRRTAGAIGVVAHDLAADVGGVLGRGNVARPPLTGGNWFIPGRHGGVYQVHSPGFSLLLFPGYLIDRSILMTGTEFHPQFPTDLYATNATVLGLYLAWTLALFSLLRVHTGDSGVSWLVAVVVMTSLPAAAFNYQYYPEVAGGLLFTWLARHVLFDRGSGRWSAAMCGVAAGFLPWLHLRFGVLTLVLAGVVALGPADRPGSRRWFWGGLLLPLAVLAVYCYYLTGSVLPWRLYELVPDSPGFDPRRAFTEVWWFALDRAWGLLPHAPVFLFAAAGAAVTWRRNRRAALTIAVAIAALALLSAAHGLTGGMTTPMRLIAAVVPLLGLPLADAIVSFRRSPFVLALFAVLALMSIQNGVSYNRFLVKHDAALAGPSMSGWKSTLAFPDLEHGGGQAYALAAAWIIGTLLIIRLPRVVAARPASDRSGAMSAAGAALSVAATAAVIAGVTGVHLAPRYLIDPSTARDRVVRAHLTQRTTPIWSPEMGTVDVPVVFANPTDAVLDIKPTTMNTTPGAQATLKVAAVGSQGDLAWGMATIDYGDGGALERRPFVGAEYVSHRYAQPGDYGVTAYLSEDSSREILQSRATVHVSDAHRP